MDFTKAAERYASDQPLHKAYKNTVEDFKAGAEHGYSEAMKWISVKDRLPENDALILLFNGEILKGYYVPDWNIFWDENADNQINATHWMPLPKYPIL